MVPVGSCLASNCPAFHHWEAGFSGAPTPFGYSLWFLPPDFHQNPPNTNNIPFRYHPLAGGKGPCIAIRPLPPPRVFPALSLRNAHVGVGGSALLTLRWTSAPPRTR